jgi:riboflavin kinase / FMN adenylyltransferase
MHVYKLEDARIESPSIVTIGVFDGVHRGHQALINQIVQEAHSTGRQAVVVTFFPHPDFVLRGLTGRYYLTSPEQQAALLKALGVDVVVTESFNEELRQMRAATFVDRLLAHVRMAALRVGEDFALGYQREGNVAFLTEQGREKGFDVKPVDLVVNDGEGLPITSTGIREALLAGNVEQARDWLGRGYTVEGPIAHGQQRGRTIGFPTANLAVWEEQVLPANGVYAGWATLNDEQFIAVTNIGVRPTFDGQNVTVEAHLLDFNRDIYDQKLTLSFEKRLRAEKKFNGIEELMAQIKADVESGRTYLTST